MVKKKNLKASSEFLDRYEHRSWTRENEVGNTVWEPTIKPISLPWKPSRGDIRLNYVNTPRCFMKKFQHNLWNTPEITSDMKCPKLSLAYEFWTCQAVLSVSVRWAHGAWPAEYINWKKRTLQTKKCVEKSQWKTVGLVVCAFTVCLENEIGWI